MKPYYQHAGITIYHGDCREILPTLGKFDLLLTDPPYGLKGAETEKNSYGLFEDEPLKVLEMVRLILSMNSAERVALTPGQSLMFDYPKPAAVGAFYYPAGTGSCSWGYVCWQPIFFYGPDPYLARGMGRRANSYSSTEQAEINGHPCPKPIGAWKWLLKRTSFAGERVIDPFMGSGTTLEAARALGINAVGIEIEEKYCEIAAKRLSQEVFDFAQPR
jgi:site-specific DNA-methyltransferase (adenine-specific)